MLAKSRRPSVSAESSEPTTLKAKLSQVQKFPKDDVVSDRLFEVINRSTLLKTLDAEQKESIILSFCGPVHIGSGENIITQGDTGDVFYLLEHGEVDVFIRNKRRSNKDSNEGKSDSDEDNDDSSGNIDAGEVNVHKYKSGDSFGELALLYNTPRAATCRAKTDCVVWTLDRISFNAIVVSAAMLKREMYQNFLKHVPILETLTDMEIMTLADSLVEEKFDHNDKVCTQGEEGHHFYIIKSGSAICTQYDEETDDEKIVANLTSGNYFGEIALLTNKNRQATVIAQDDLIVLSIDRATFTRVLGEMDEILRRNMVKYEKYSGAK